MNKLIMMCCIIFPVWNAYSELECSELECFYSLAEVRKKFIPVVKECDWSRCINSHGRKEETYSSVTTLWSDGSWSKSWWGHSRKNCGTVYAVPISDFIIERKFQYKDRGIMKEGKIVAVEISIICTDPDVGKDVLRRTVLNYVENGVNVPRIDSQSDYGNARQIRLSNSGAKSSISTRPGRIISFKNAVKKRFGADSCVYLDGASKDGRIRVLALGCRTARERLDITPLTMQ